jgi:hypothetical protein
VADQLRRHFARLYVWEDVPREGFTAARRLNANGYIGQSESADELAALRELERESDYAGPLAQVGNTFGGPWTPLLECYDVPTIPSDLGQGFPVLGTFTGTPRLRDYLPSLGARRDFSIYLAEEMQADDWLALANLH